MRFFTSEPWLSEEDAIVQAVRSSRNFSMKFRHAVTMVVKGDGGYLTLQGNHPVGTKITWDELDLVIVALYSDGVKFA